MNRLPQPGCQTNKKFDKISGYSLVIFLLVLWVAIIYSNTLQSSWHLDDYANIQSNPRVLINDLKPGTLWQTFFASPEGKRKPYRSLAYLSFALNAFVHRTDVLGYHLVNITVHVLTTLLLFATVLAVMKTPAMKGVSRSHAFMTAVLTAALWSVNPIHTQAVTYIVQRMASMAAMFYLLAVYLYLTARLKPNFGARLALFILCAMSYICALFSKENAALLPLILLLVEFIFFRDLRDKRVKVAFRSVPCRRRTPCPPAGDLPFRQPVQLFQGVSLSNLHPHRKVAHRGPCSDVVSLADFLSCTGPAFHIS